MRKLNYNIYNNINEDEYLAIQEKLILIESEAEQLLKSTGWAIMCPVIKRDGLGIDFVLKEGIFYGNLGILFEDEPNVLTFTFYVTKSFDEKRTRYFLADDIFKNKKFDFFENNISVFINKALRKYNNLSKADITALGIVGEIL